MYYIYTALVFELMGKSSRKKQSRLNQIKHLGRRNQWLQSHSSFSSTTLKLSLEKIDPVALAMKKWWDSNKYKMSLKDQMETVIESYADSILQVHEEERRGAVLCLEASEGFTIFAQPLEKLEEKRSLDPKFVSLLLKYVMQYDVQTEVVVGYVNDKEEFTAMTVTIDNLKRYELSL